MRTITFLATPWTIAAAVITWLVVAGFSFIAWRRSGYRPAIAGLEVLRLAIVALIGIILNQPEWVESYRPTEKPTIGVLWDASASMGTRDALPADSPTAVPVTRREAIAPFTRDETWQPLRERFDVALQPFSHPKTGSGTDLSTPLTAAAEKLQSLAGVVLISDGDWNEGDPPVEAAVRLRLANIPVFAVPVGSPQRLPDVELLSLDAPTFAIVGKSVRIPFTIESSLPREFTTIVALRTSNGDEVTKDIRVAPEGRTNDAIVWKPKETGNFTVSLEVPKQATETLPDNNKLTVPISIREEKLRVLLVESLPRWEYRYLRNALSRDPGVQLSCLLFHPGLDKVGGGNKDYIKEFPNTLEALAKYDVVFLGDVGLENELTTDECRMLRGLVEFQASGLVFLPGIQGREFSLLDTPLKDLYPVVLDSTQPSGWGSRTPSHFQLTELGERSLLTKLADYQQENAEVWDNLPGFQWYAPVVRAKAGTEVLCVHSDISNDYGRLPLLVTQTFGAGKVLFMGTDGAWRWRKGVEDKYHYRFWGQVVRWMAYQRNMAKGETMRLYYSPDQPLLGKTVMLKANVMERSGEPLSKGDVAARITAPSGRVQTIQFTSLNDEWGAFTGQYVSDEPGQHHVTLSCRQTGATLDATFFVQGAPKEPVGKPARPEVLEEIARVSRGKVIASQEISKILTQLRDLPEPPPIERRLQLWCHPITAGFLISMFGAFWVARKTVGLI
ncbi:MAG TPA: hypothetical protein VFW73_00325 [Lacipirellulaceae bacterium]|nr:hypothetical protein [Lacipirellulaceae bacterium]